MIDSLSTISRTLLILIKVVNPQKVAILTNVNIRHSDFTGMKVINQYAKTEVSIKRTIFQSANTKKKKKCRKSLTANTFKNNLKYL